MNAEAAAAHPSRLPEDAVTPVEGLHDSNSDGFWPTSGRSEPRPEPRTTPCDVRFHGARDGYGLVAYCDPCDWSVRLEDGHTIGDLTELARQHCGPLTPPSPLGVRLCDSTTGETTCQLPAGHYAGHHATWMGHSITWPQADVAAFFGDETNPGGA